MGDEPGEQPTGGEAGPVGAHPDARGTSRHAALLGEQAVGPLARARLDSHVHEEHEHPEHDEHRRTIRRSRLRRGARGPDRARREERDRDARLEREEQHVDDAPRRVGVQQAGDQQQTQERPENGDQLA